MKFALSDESARRLEADLFLGATVESLQTLYFDTPDHRLAKSGVSLRLRNSRDGWLQTIKQSGAGLAREEDEIRRAAPTLALNRLRSLPPRIKRRDIGPVFETRVLRQTHTVEVDGGIIEFALDKGEITAGPRRQPLLELELELKQGEPAALFKFASSLLARGGLTPILRSKAERGYALIAGRELTPWKARTSCVSRSMAAPQAFQALVMDALKQVEANAALVCQSDDPEAVHQARIGLRRLRVIVGALSRITHGRSLDQLKDSLRSMTRLFGEARALDVVIEHTRREAIAGAPRATELLCVLNQARAAAYGDLKRDSTRTSFARSTFAILEWATVGSCLQAREANPLTEPLADIAADLVDHRSDVLRKRGRSIDWADAPARHRLRIEAKKLRYLVEGLHPVLRRDRAFDRRLKRFQDRLGALNDISAATGVFTGALRHHRSVDAAFEAGRLVERWDRASVRLARKARKAFDRLDRETPPRPRQTKA